MQILVVGTGYVGLVVGACLADTGNDVVCADVDAIKIDGLRQNILPIYEPGLAELVRRNQEQHRLRFSTDVAAAAARAEIVFLAVGTPSDDDGSADLQYVLAAARTVGQSICREVVVVTKSTVPMGTAAMVRAVISEHSAFPVHVCSNPEFLKEGAAVQDFLRPDRVVLGVESDYARDVLAELYAPFVRTGNPILFMDVASAELTKYAANAMLATRISFMNEIAALCERVGADVEHVRRGLGSDERIGGAFLFPGPGYGGSCFPKDVKALLRTSQQYGVPLRVIAATDAANEQQHSMLFTKVVAALGKPLRSSRIAIWGLSFKPCTDDVRESPALVLIEQLLEAGATVVAHDPVAMPRVAAIFGDRITLAGDNMDAAAGADALVIVTDWNEYRNPELERLRAALAHPVIIDGRNLYSPARMTAMGFTYHSVGRPRA